MSEQRFTLIDGDRVVETDRQDGIARARDAERAGRPVAMDLDARAACIGVAAEERARGLTSLEAPDFSLPDLGGRMHSLSEHRGKKVLLIAYASW